jgi:hypothetical protein
MDHEKIFKEQIDTPAAAFSIKLQGLFAAPERFQEKSSMKHGKWQKGSGEDTGAAGL